MILCVNIGNSNIVLGLYNGTWISRWRLSTILERTPDEYEFLILPFITRAGITPDDIHAMALASVVPILTETFSQLSRHMFRRNPFSITPMVKTGLSFANAASSAEMGADLLANAVAGYTLVNTDTQKQGVIIVDFGTALTFTMVSSDARILGVSIAPGLHGAVKSLADDAAQLPHVQLAVPPQAIGTNTIYSIQSGIVFGFTGLVESMLTRIRSEMEDPISVIATGGMHHIIAVNTDCFHYLEPWLHLKGIQQIYALNN